MGYLDLNNSLIDNDENAAKLNQLITYVLVNLPSLPDTAGSFERAFLPTIKVILKAPSKSPLATINIDEVVKFLLHICQSYHHSVSIENCI